MNVGSDGCCGSIDGARAMYSWSGVPECSEML